MANELINKLKKSTSALSFLQTLGIDLYALNADEDDLTLEMLKTFTANELLVKFFFFLIIIYYF